MSNNSPFTLPVDPWIKFTASTVGRDKLYRTVQYVCKLLAYYQSTDSDSQLRLQRLSAAVGMARKRISIMNYEYPG